MVLGRLAGGKDKVGMHLVHPSVLLSPVQCPAGTVAGILRRCVSHTQMSSQTGRLDLVARAAGWPTLVSTDSGAPGQQLATDKH